VLALQYFGGDRDIFPFDRNAKSFVVALFILIFALPCLTYILHCFVNLVVELAGRVTTKPRRKSGGADNSSEFKAIQSRPHLANNSRYF
jgi:hypothetical protein